MSNNKQTQEQRIIKIERVWAMPSKHTFTIKPIAELLKRYDVGTGWIDPFAGENSPCEFTNDLNPNKPTQAHKHAKTYCEEIEGEFTGCVFDPPYSLYQLKTVYESIGEKIFKDDKNYFPHNVKQAIAPKIKIDGTVICFGWNSQGFGKNLGFQLIEVLLIAHGKSHNDTIVTVERKL